MISGKFGDDSRLSIQLTKFIRHVNNVELQHAENGTKWTRDEQAYTYFGHENICQWMFHSFAEQRGVTAFQMLQLEAEETELHQLSDVPYHVVKLCVIMRFRALVWLALRLNVKTHTAGKPSSVEPDEPIQN